MLQWIDFERTLKIQRKWVRLCRGEQDWSCTNKFRSWPDHLLVKSPWPTGNWLQDGWLKKQTTRWTLTFRIFRTWSPGNSTCGQEETEATTERRELSPNAPDAHLLNSGVHTALQWATRSSQSDVVLPLSKDHWGKKCSLGWGALYRY